MGCLKKEQILGAKDLKSEKVLVPEWSDGEEEAYVMVRSMSARERDEWEGEVFSTNLSDLENPVTKINKSDYRARLCALCMVDDEGNRLFTTEDIPDLSGKSAAALERVFSVVQRLNGMLPKSVETAEKNF